MRVRLTGGAYTARSLAASAQRQVNLYSEAGAAGAIEDLGAQQQQPIAALYPTPGLSRLLPTPVAGPARGLYWASSGVLFYVVGTSLYRVLANWGMVHIGAIAPGTTPVSMADNGRTLVLVDGTPTGYQVDLASFAFRKVNNTPYPAGNAPTVESTMVYGFYGADRVAVIDGFMLLNQPNTSNFYSTYNNEIVFDSLYIAAKSGFADKLVTLAVNQRVIWLIGERTTELWIDAGAADFPFTIMPGPFIQHGCVAKYSLAQINDSVYWLSQDQAGRNVMVRSQGYQATRISTFAIEAAWAGYPTTADAVGLVFQLLGHSFYQITFPAADKTWRYDEASGEWHEAVWLDSNGAEHRHRAGCMAHAYGRIVAGDWENGALYELDANNYTDAGAPMKRLRDFPHLIADGDRVFYRQFAADLETGAGP